ncbi:hypothetical protein GGI25_004921 [Coemansia spiralis]|uniref:Uncharacterized protein n=2 Tax=Coemansia TaxID=4863 RepID=A0A9W8G550_9FUNG|nr:hypothetical protein EDC05_005190 [Coemansia umbellata]KAJ2622424.1 hypothetical protein GGI26_003287 [Coemansia sp. RSA 1358]KAJ2672878.1 hypothetical protein GGI25_004921 [Coemansia spiralis]
MNSDRQNSTVQQSDNPDEFLESYLAQIKEKLDKVPVEPNKEVDELKLLLADTEAPPDRRMFYRNDHIEEIAKQECAECEYKWQTCRVNPPTMYDRFIGCTKLKLDYKACMKKVAKRYEDKDFGDPLGAMPIKEHPVKDMLHSSLKR